MLKWDKEIEEWAGPTPKPKPKRRLSLARGYGKKPFDLMITRRSMKSCKVTVMAANYFDAVEAALKKVRCGEGNWSDETAVVQFECANLDPEACPVLP